MFAHQLYADGSLDLTNANSIRAFRAFADFEFDGVSVLNFAFDFRDVNEEVIATFLLYESVSFCLVKPLDCTLCHEAMVLLGVYYLWGRLILENPDSNRKEFSPRVVQTQLSRYAENLVLYTHSVLNMGAFEVAITTRFLNP